MATFKIIFLDIEGNELFSKIDSFYDFQDAEKYAKNNAFKEEIMECGFNTNSGYIYIALENGICIASSFGQGVDYIITDFETV